MREEPAAFRLIGTPKARIGKKTKLIQSVFKAEVVVWSISSARASATWNDRTSGFGWECDRNGEVVRFASGRCQHCQRSWGSSSGVPARTADVCS